MLRLFRWCFTVRLKRLDFNYMPYVRFEHVALRFLGEGRKAGLLEYLRCRLKVADDQVGGTRYKMCYSMLKPFSASHLATEKPSDFQASEGDALAAQRLGSGDLFGETE